MRPWMNMFAALLLVPALLLAPGCGKGGTGARKKGTVKGARVVIKTGGYVPGAPGIYRKLAAGGIAPLGDINGDGYTDLVVASGTYPGSFAAFSGKDGTMFWRVKAKTSNKAKEDGESGYTFADFALAGDVNGDGVPDVFIRNDWTPKDAFLFSGKDGQRLLRTKTAHLFRPIRVDDLSGDGVPDLIFRHGRTVGLRVFSGHDLSEVMAREDLLGTGGRQRLLVPRFPDVDGDGMDEYLAAVEEGDATEFVMFSGADFSEVKRLTVAGRLVGTTSSFAGPGDLNGDGVPDVVMASRNGGGPGGESSYLAALSGADGAEVWRVVGTDVPGGVPMIAVDVETGARRELPGDVKFGSRIAVLPDLNGDKAPELAAALPTLVGKRRSMGLVVFCGATGERLITLCLHKRQGRLVGSQMVLIESADGKGGPGLVVDAKLAKHEYAVAIFVLPRIAE